MLIQAASMFVLAFALSLDSFGVGMTYGLRRVRIPIFSIVIISICSGMFIWLSMQAEGSWCGTYLQPLRSGPDRLS